MALVVELHSTSQVEMHVGAVMSWRAAAPTSSPPASLWRQGAGAMVSHGATLMAARSSHSVPTHYSKPER